MKSGRIGIAIGLGLGWIVTVMLFFSSLQPLPVLADGNTITVCTSGCDYTTIQAAIDAATAGDTIKIAEGTYTHVFSRAGVRQIAYISKTITLEGGYAAGNWDSPDPDAHPTILDAQNNGRGISIFDNTHPVIDGIRIINGNAAGMLADGPDRYDGGGGIYAHRAYVTLQNTQISSCTAQVGAGIFSYYGALTITNASITTNTVQKWGGGMRGFGTAVTVQNSLIASNVTTDAYSLAGGFYLTFGRPAIFINNVISNNSATQAGGGFLMSNSDCTFTSNTIANNRSLISVGAGGHVQSNSACTFDDNTIIGNEAFYDGGGLAINTASVVTLTHNRIENNTAGRYGGGVYVYSNAAVTMTNNIFRENISSGGSSSGSAYALGDALAVAGAHVNSWHNDFISNSGGQNIGIYINDYTWGGTLYTGTLMLTNTIIATQPTGIHVENGNRLDVTGILWYNVPVTVTQDITALVSVSHQATGNPQFLADGYHIPDTSAARKQGVPSRITTDIDGEPFLNPPDVGVDQYVFGNVYLPLILRNG